MSRRYTGVAWGDVRHRIICDIVFQELNEGTPEHPTEQLCAQGL